MEGGIKSMAYILSAPQRCKEDKGLTGRLLGAQISGHQVVSHRSMVYIQSAAWSYIRVKTTQSGGIGYMLLNPMAERWSQITSIVEIDSGTRTCTINKPKAPSGMCYPVIDLMVENQSESNQRLLWFSESELARWIIPKCPVEFGTWHMIWRWKFKGVSHQWMRMIPEIKAGRRLKWWSPAEFGRCHTIQRLTSKGWFHLRLWEILEHEVAWKIRLGSSVESNISFPI